MGLALVAKSTETEPALCLPGQTVADCEETACRVVMNFNVVCSYAYVLNVTHKSYLFINVDKTPFVIGENSL